MMPVTKARRESLMIDDGWEDRYWFDGKLHIVHSNGPSGSQHGIKTAETLHIVAPEMAHSILNKLFWIRVYFLCPGHPRAFAWEART